MSNIEHKDYIDIRDLDSLVSEAIELTNNAEEDPDSGTTATELLNANEDIEAVLSILRELGYPADDANDISRAIDQVTNRVGVTFIADTYLMESAEESLRDWGVMPADTHPWLTVELDEEAVKRSYTEVTLDGKSYYFEKE